MKPFIVGFCGKAGSGKDTAAEALGQLAFHRFAFADPIKEMLNVAFGWKPEKWLDREWKESNLPGRNYSPRRLAQTMGTEWGRYTVDPDLWHYVIESRITASGVSRVVITDVRFDNEARWIKQQGGLVIELLRPSVVPVAEHVSEKGVSTHLVDFTLLNHGTKEDFVKQVRQEIFHRMQAMNAL